MTIGSLFSGIGGLELGLEMCGLGPVLWQCDSDPAARTVLAEHWPDAHRYDDVRGIDGTARHVDLICGGFPCQDISNAGRRAGIDGERSGLWGEFARVVRLLRPQYVFVENVAALAHRGLPRVLGDLSTLGFDAEWDVFRACDVGAPHRRERLFILAYTDRALANSDGAPRGPEAGDAIAGTGGEALRRGQAKPRRRGGDVADADRARLAVGKEQSARNELPSVERSGPALSNADGVTPGRIAESRGECSSWGVEPDVGRVAHGVSARVDRLRLLGNAVVPSQAALAFRVLSRQP
jgi:DNA (cytosine-5)-methyltransferase 1